MSYVMVKADWGGEGLFDANGAAMTAADLPVTEDTRRKLARWCAAWDDHVPFGVGRPGGFDVRAFAEDGLAVARAIKAELPDWTVVYHNEAAARRYLTAHREGLVGRDAFESVVT